MNVDQLTTAWGQQVAKESRLKEIAESLSEKACYFLCWENDDLEPYLFTKQEITEYLKLKEPKNGQNEHIAT